MSATVDQCGDLSFSDASIISSGPLDGNRLRDITVAASYPGGRVSIVFDFYEDITTRSYTVVEDADFDGEVEVTITAFAFGGSIDEPDSFDAFNGTVTITSISDLSAVGTYDIGIDTNSNDIADLFFNGSFDFDLE